MSRASADGEVDADMPGQRLSCSTQTATTTTGTSVSTNSVTTLLKGSHSQHSSQSLQHHTVRKRARRSGGAHSPQGRVRYEVGGYRAVADANVGDEEDAATPSASQRLHRRDTSSYEDSNGSSSSEAGATPTATDGGGPRERQPEQHVDDAISSSTAEHQCASNSAPRQHRSQSASDNIPTGISADDEQQLWHPPAVGPPALRNSHEVVDFLASIGLQGYAGHVVLTMGIESYDKLVEAVPSDSGAATLLGRWASRQHQADLWLGLQRRQRELERRARQEEVAERRRANEERRAAAAAARLERRGQGRGRQKTRETGSGGKAASNRSAASLTGAVTRGGPVSSAAPLVTNSGGQGGDSTNWEDLSPSQVFERIFNDSDDLHERGRAAVAKHMYNTSAAKALAKKPDGASGGGSHSTACSFDREQCSPSQFFQGLAFTGRGMASRASEEAEAAPDRTTGVVSLTATPLIDVDHDQVGSSGNLPEADPQQAPSQEAPGSLCSSSPEASGGDDDGDVVRAVVVGDVVRHPLSYWSLGTLFDPPSPPPSPPRVDEGVGAEKLSPVAPSPPPLRCATQPTEPPSSSAVLNGTPVGATERGAPTPVEEEGSKVRRLPDPEIDDFDGHISEEEIQPVTEEEAKMLSPSAPTVISIDDGDELAQLRSSITTLLQRYNEKLRCSSGAEPAALRAVLLPSHDSTPPSLPDLVVMGEGASHGLVVPGSTSTGAAPPCVGGRTVDRASSPVLLRCQGSGSIARAVDSNRGGASPVDPDDEHPGIEEDEGEEGEEEELFMNCLTATAPQGRASGQHFLAATAAAVSSGNVVDEEEPRGRASYISTYMEPFISSQTNSCPPYIAATTGSASHRGDTGPCEALTREAVAATNAADRLSSGGIDREAPRTTQQAPRFVSHMERLMTNPATSGETPPLTPPPAPNADDTCHSAGAAKDTTGGGGDDRDADDDAWWESFGLDPLTGTCLTQLSYDDFHMALQPHSPDGTRRSAAVDVDSDFSTASDCEGVDPPCSSQARRLTGSGSAPRSSWRRELFAADSLDDSDEDDRVAGEDADEATLLLPPNDLPTSYSQQKRQDSVTGSGNAGSGATALLAEPPSQQHQQAMAELLSLYRAGEPFETLPLETLSRLCEAVDIPSDVVGVVGTQHEQQQQQQHCLNEEVIQGMACTRLSMFTAQERVQLEREARAEALRLLAVRSLFFYDAAPAALHRVPRVSGLPYRQIKAAHLLERGALLTAEDLADAKQVAKAMAVSEVNRCIVAALAADACDFAESAAQPHGNGVGWGRHAPGQASLSTYERALLMEPVNACAATQIVQGEFPFISRSCVYKLLEESDVPLEVVSYGHLSPPPSSPLPSPPPQPPLVGGEWGISGSTLDQVAAAGAVGGVEHPSPRTPPGPRSGARANSHHENSAASPVSPASRGRSVTPQTPTTPIAPSQEQRRRENSRRFFATRGFRTRGGLFRGRGRGAGRGF